MNLPLLQKRCCLIKYFVTNTDSKRNHSPNMRNSLLFRCRSLYDQLDRFLDGEMGLWEHLLVKGHLMMCPQCRVYLRQYSQIRTLSLQQQQEQLPPDFEQVMGPIVARWKSEQNS